MFGSGSNRASSLAVASPQNRHRNNKSGGGYQTSDIETYFSGLGLTPPVVVAVSVDGGTNAPGDPNGADGEVALDIQVAGSIANGARIAVYFAPNTDQGFIDAITTAVHASTNKPSVLSISWGGPESTWAQTSVTALDDACQSAAALGVTITVASGDNGSSDGRRPGATWISLLRARMCWGAEGRS